MTADSSNSAPAWFQRAVRSPYEEHEVAVDSCGIRYLAWGDREAPPLVLLHGGAAHAHWWAFIAPLLADRFRIVAPHMRGMGDSDYSDSYTMDQFVGDVMAVCDHAELTGRVKIIGHSMGGYVTLKTALTQPHRVDRIVVVDSAIRTHDDPRRFNPKKSPFRSKKRYSTLGEACRQFRLVPDQPCENTYLMEYIARHSLKPVDGGWTWKFDVNFMNRLQIDYMREAIPNLSRPCGILHGEHSRICTPDVIASMKSLFPAGTPFVEIPGAHHHVMLDRPLEFVEALIGILNGNGQDG